MVKHALQVMRRHLGLQVAYVSEFVDGQSVFREVDAPGLEDLIILAGRLPELIPDTAREPVAMAMPITAAVPIGAHVSVPIRLSDGEVYGMFCCLGPNPDLSLNRRDLQMMRAFADLAAFDIDRRRKKSQAAEERRGRILALIDQDGVEGQDDLVGQDGIGGQDGLSQGGFSIVHQPICALPGLGILGYECLSRFTAEPLRTPDLWFAEAEEVGLRQELEIAALRKALASAAHLPAGAYMSINVSPATLLCAAFHTLLARHPGDGLVVEITENATVEDYAVLSEALRPLRGRGFRLAVDDAGAGYASMQHILQLRPDIIKLDMQLTRDIDADPARRALAAALIGFAHDIDSLIVAEGVETEAELQVLRALGTDAVQGYLIGRPQPLAALLDTAEVAAA